MALSPIRNCNEAGGNLCNYTEYRVATEYNIANNIWYRDEDDFTTNERTGSYSGNTEEITASGNPRVKNKIINFAETKEVTIGESTDSNFLRMLHEVQLQSDDYILDFLNCGMDHRKVTCFSDGALTIQECNGMQTTAMDKVFEQLNGAENEIAMTFEVGNEPVNTLIGFSAPLPKNIKDVEINATTVATADTITATITDVIAGDVDVVPTVPAGNEIIAVLYEITDKSISNVVEVQYSANPVATPFEFTGLTAGNYLLGLGYHSFVDSTGASQYRFVTDIEVEIA